MEFVDGVNLRQMIRGGALTPDEALKIVPQICEALQFAHEEGVVHRDIKPENILLDKRGRLKIADFGLAKLLGRTDSALLLTQTYQVMGTLHYMAPEQFERPTAVDHRADIYSLGVVFYELLTGQLPLGRYALPSEKVYVDSRLDDVVLKTLEREPDRRYQHASDVKTDIENISKVGCAPPTSGRFQPPYTAVGGQSNPYGSPPASAAVPGAAALTASQWEAARRKVQAPAIGLMVAGVLNFFPYLLLLLAPLAWWIMPRPSMQPFASLPVAGEYALGLPTQVAGIACAVWLRDISSLPLALLGWQEGPPMEASHAVAGLGMMEVILLPLLLLSFPLGILMILGGVKMRRLELYGLVLVAAIVALLPCGPSFLVSMPIGIWALVVLLNADVKAAFGQRPAAAEVIAEKKPPLLPILPPLPGDDAALASYSGRTTGPGTALVVVGALSALFWLVMFVVSLSMQLHDLSTGSNGANSGLHRFDPTAYLSALGLLFALAILHGGLRMRSRTSFGWAMLASVLAMLPVSPACLLGFWVGLWSIFKLQSYSVKRAFAAAASQAPPATLASVIAGPALVLGPPALLAAAGLGLSMAANAQRPEPVGTILMYDVEMPGRDNYPSPNEALAFCEARVNNGKRKIAQLKIVNPQNWERGATGIEIGVFGSDHVVANRIEERLLAQGKIEFAILADSETDSQLIARAMSNPGTEVPAESVKPENGAAPPPPVARWVTLLPRAERQLQDPFGAYREFATRPKPDGGTEVLVLVDPLNVTEKELSLARVVSDRIKGEVQVELAFNSEGARKMRTLTSRPENQHTAFKTRCMAIIIDDALFTAPRLRSTLADQLQLTGEFTIDEADYLVCLVRAGKPPTLIKQVSRKAVIK